MGSNREESRIAIAVFENKQFDSSPKIIFILALPILYSLNITILSYYLSSHPFIKSIHMLWVRGWGAIQRPHKIISGIVGLTRIIR